MFKCPAAELKPGEDRKSYCRKGDLNKNKEKEDTETEANLKP